MGGVDGGKKKKKKPERAKRPIMSKMSSARKLSRFGKVRKSGESGKASAFVTRATALRRLQVTLRDFRRLCILKGVYPRDVKSKDSSKAYYAVKDIAAIAHEPLLEKFREFKTLMRKVRRSVGRGDVEAARRTHARAAPYTLHHVIKERYPTFGDALHDLDDALSMVCLFASLPAEGRISVDIVERCDALQRKWETWVIKTRSLTKAFISVKGVYFEATVANAGTVAWLVPHRFAASTPSKKAVDYRVMLTFLELYEVLLKFVLHKLYKDDAPAIAQPDPTAGVFEDLTFAFSREAQYPWLHFLLCCGGGRLADDPTHVVTDRPKAHTLKHLAGRHPELVQPQWVVDSFNTALRLPVAKYAPGATLPPHLSPFVQATEDDYVPAYRDELDNLKSAYAGLRKESNKNKNNNDDDERSGKKKEDNTGKERKASSSSSSTTSTLARIVMSKKAKRLHGRMLYGIERKREAVQKLRARRAALEASSAST
ncbi:hypothetical protein CTAYLR_000949 [Chrysophaeum taylorii]|uniref:Pescadillo homolog n=1 Tax=Chrysophaeum taylorii TaxID=2483200 RepID=A0AAD7UFB1_9STRA|nr:hypothetical protein CTAYLR_000949 [Chrysophaeum taylorii]